MSPKVREIQAEAVLDRRNLRQEAVWSWKTKQMLYGQQATLLSMAEKKMGLPWTNYRFHRKGSCKEGLSGGIMDPTKGRATARSSAEWRIVNSLMEERNTCHRRIIVVL